MRVTNSMMISQLMKNLNRNLKRMKPTIPASNRETDSKAISRSGRHNQEPSGEN